MGVGRVSKCVPSYSQGKAVLAVNVQQKVLYMLYITS